MSNYNVILHGMSVLKSDAILYIHDPVGACSYPRISFHICQKLYLLFSELNDSKTKFFLNDLLMRLNLIELFLLIIYIASLKQWFSLQHRPPQTDQHLTYLPT